MPMLDTLEERLEQLEEKLQGIRQKPLFLTPRSEEKVFNGFDSISYDQFFRTVNHLSASFVSDELKVDIGDTVVSFLDQKVPNLPDILALDLAVGAVGATYVPRYKKANFFEIRSVIKENKSDDKGTYIIVEDANTFKRVYNSFNGNIFDFEKIIIMKPKNFETLQSTISYSELAGIDLADINSKIISYETLLTNGKDNFEKNKDNLSKRKEVLSERPVNDKVVYTRNALVEKNKKFLALGVKSSSEKFAWLTEKLSSFVDIGHNDFLCSYLPHDHVFACLASYLAMYNGATIYNHPNPKYLNSIEANKDSGLFMPGVPLQWEYILGNTRSSTPKLLRIIYDIALNISIRKIEFDDLAEVTIFDKIKKPVFDFLNIFSEKFFEQYRQNLWNKGEITFFSGGALLDENLLRKLKAVFSRNVYNGYGATACPIISIRKPDGIAKTVGQEFYDTTTRIVSPDEDFKELEAGEYGEIIVSGPQVMGGYVSHPGLTELSFRRLKFPGDETEKLYFFTGDIGKKDQDGNIVIKGPRYMTVTKTAENNDTRYVEEKIVKGIESLTHAYCVGTGRGSLNRRGSLGLLCFYKRSDNEEDLQEKIRNFINDDIHSDRRIPRFERPNRNLITVLNGQPDDDLFFTDHNKEKRIDRALLHERYAEVIDRMYGNY
ncbi:AMP-binding protein [Candidatus Woesearchaeota archaeon]|nr:AMP-binding protein [Candidatus Woesearchaeota archaeon]